MARTGLTREQVRETRAALLAQGVHPSADAVRRALGDTGSKSTIHRFLKELAAEDTGAAPRRADTVARLHAAVALVADELHADAERRMRALVAEHERALRARDEELAALRATVAALQAQVQAAQRPAPPPPATPGPVRPPLHDRAAGRPIGGFGNFGGLLAHSRAGRGETSAFSIVLAGGRSDILAADPPAPPGLAT